MGANKVMRFAVLLAFGACGNLTCDQNKQESIKAMNMGVEAASTKSYATAEKELDRALTLDPENHKAAYALGLIFVDQRKWDKAQDSFEKALKNNKDDAMYHYNLGHTLYEQGK